MLIFEDIYTRFIKLTETKLVRLKLDTVQRLEELGSMKDSYNSVVQKLLTERHKIA